MDILKKRTDLKEYFQAGKQPTEAQFAELIEAILINIGNVGIGTDTPKNTLDVKGNAIIGTAYGGASTAPPNGLYVEGNVGIGRTTADSKLHVEGAVRIESGGLYIGGDKVISEQGEWLGSISGDDDEPAPSPWQDGNGKVTTDDNVGIKLSNPQAPLHVQGNVRIEQGGLMINDKVVIDNEGNWEGVPIAATGGVSPWLETDESLETGKSVGIGKSLAVAGLVNKQQVVFSVNGFQSLVDKTLRIQFEEAIGKDMEFWDLQNGYFMVPVGGLYSFNAHVTLGNPEHTVTLSVEDPSKKLKTLVDVKGSNDSLSGSASIIVELSKDDKVGLYVADINAQPSQVNLSGHRL